MTKIVRTASALRAMANLLDEVDLPEPTDLFDGISLSTQTAFPGLRIFGEPGRVGILADHLGVTLVHSQTDAEGHSYSNGSTQIDGHRLEFCAVTPPPPPPMSTACTSHPDRESVGGHAGGGKPTVLCCQECMDAVYEAAL